MKFALISIFPGMFDSFLNFGIVGKAIKRQDVKILLVNPRQITENFNLKIDDRPFGGGPGMVMKYEPLEKAILLAKKRFNENAKVIYLSPQGKKLNQNYINYLCKEDAIILLCGRYNGIDERLIDDYVDEEISIGDYIVSGGEVPAMIFMDSLIRVLPNALHNPCSVFKDSFYNTNFLDYPSYTRPFLLKNGKTPPAVLLSGDHSKIKQWRVEQMLKRTFKKRKDLIKFFSKGEKKIMNAYLQKYKNF